jgi:hypothetical protein
MRARLQIALLGAAVAALANPADRAGAAPAAKARLRAASPDGKRVAEVQRRAAGGEGLFVDGRLYWPAAGSRTTARVTTELVWSRRSDAVALVAREPSGAVTLVVAVVAGDAAPTALSWPIPEAALPARAIMWLGPTRVAVGPGEMDPKVVASWTTSR